MTLSNVQRNALKNTAVGYLKYSNLAQWRGTGDTIQEMNKHSFSISFVFKLRRPSLILICMEVGSIVKVKSLQQSN